MYIYGLIQQRADLALCHGQIYSPYVLIAGNKQLTQCVVSRYSDLELDRIHGTLPLSEVAEWHKPENIRLDWWEEWHVGVTSGWYREVTALDLLILYLGKKERVESCHIIADETWLRRADVWLNLRDGITEELGHIYATKSAEDEEYDIYALPGFRQGLKTFVSDSSVYNVALACTRLTTKQAVLADAGDYSYLWWRLYPCVSGAEAALIRADSHIPLSMELTRLVLSYYQLGDKPAPTMVMRETYELLDKHRLAYYRDLLYDHSDTVTYRDWAYTLWLLGVTYDI